jgi:hypothetical protein
MSVLFSSSKGGLHWSVFLAPGTVRSFLMFNILQHPNLGCLRQRRGYRQMIVIILFIFTEHEYIFMATGTSVLYTLRHPIRFIPNNILPEIPSRLPDRQGHHPWNAQQILPLDTVMQTWRRSIFLTVPLTASLTTASRRGVGVTQNKPHGSVARNYPLQFVKQSHQMADVRLRRVFLSPLTSTAIIPLSEIRWTRDNRSNRSVRKSTHPRYCINSLYLVPLHILPLAFPLIPHSFQ